MGFAEKVRRTLPSQLTRVVVAFCTLIPLLLVVVCETAHHHRYGHFVGYGIHLDVLSEESAATERLLSDEHG